MGLNATVSGVSQAGGPVGGETWNTGDTINGGGAAAANIINLLGNGNTAATGEVVTVNNVARINVDLVAPTQLQGANWSGVGQAWMNTNVAGNTLTVNNGELATIYGANNTSVNSIYAVGIRATDLNGANDTLKLTANNAGIRSGAAASTVTFNSIAATGVENVEFTGTGSNNIVLTGTMGATTDLVKLTVKGAGVNTIATQGLTQLLTIDGSAASGGNVYNVGTSLLTNEVITGGTGVDTLRATTSGQVRTGLTVTGVENLRLDSGGAASTLAFASNPGFTTVQLDAGAAGANGFIKTLANVGSFANLNYVGTGTAATAANSMIFNAVTATGGFAGASDTLAINVSNGGVTTTNAAPYVLGDLTANGVENFNYTVADNTAGSPLAVQDITSNTITSVKFTTNGIVTQTAADLITSGLVANVNTLSTIDLSGVTGVGGSNVNIGDGVTAGLLSAAATITASTGGTTVVVNAVEAATDVITFNGGAGADFYTNTLYAGNVVASLGAGNDNVTFTTAAQTATLTGGGGADTFVVRTVGGAVITDLGVGGADVLDNRAGATVATVGANWTSTAASGVTAGSVTLNMASGVTTVNVAASAVGALGYTINADANTASTITGSGFADIITGSNLNDVLTGGAGADRITGGLGADTFGSASNFGASGQSVVASANTLTGAGIAAGNTITYATGAAGTVDRVLDFVSGVDKLDVVTANTAPTNLVGVAVAGSNAAGTTYVAYGNYNNATGGFTISATWSAGTPDAIVYVGDGALTAATTTGAVVLTGLNQALVATDFV